MLALDLPYAPTLAFELLPPVPALSRPVTDFGPFNDLLFRWQFERQQEAASSQAAEIISGASPQAEASTLVQGVGSRTPASTSDAWLTETLSVIHRDLAASPELRERTEALAFHLTGSSFERRPQILVDDDGIPAFAVSTDAFYMNLTLDSPSHLTWFAVENGVEHFAESVPFVGTHLPQELVELLLVRA